MIRMSDDEIMKWYQAIHDWKSSGMKVPQYCRMHNVNYKQFSDVYRSLVFKRDKNPELHARLINIIQVMKEQHIPYKKASEMYGINLSTLAQISTYLNYQSRLKKIHEKRGLPFEEEVVPMQFIELGNEKKEEPKQDLTPLLKIDPPAPSKPDLIEKKNDVELIIQKGVRVLVSPEVGTDKLIKIIELLKDL